MVQKLRAITLSDSALKAQNCYLPSF
jgi:hypothetical protein